MSARPKEPPERPSDDVKTSIYDPSKRSGQVPAQKVTGPIQAISMKTPDPSKSSGPIQAISMKTPSDARADEPSKTPAMPRPKLRAMADVAAPKPSQDLGNLAPPYDANEARMRTMQDYIIWGCVAVILASAIALVVWFVAR